MRRYSKGGVCQQHGRWRGLWYENGIKKTRILGLCKEMTKTEAREAVAAIITDLKPQSKTLLGPFVEGTYFEFYSRKWKASTAENNKQRIRTHIVGAFEDRELSSLKRDELQDFLDSKGGMSFSVVDHLKWDLKAIYDLAISEEIVQRNPALLLFTPKTAAKPVRAVMTVQQISIAFGCLDIRERLIAKLAVLAGMRPGEIFGLKWGRIGEAFAEVTQRVYRNKVDTPKTNQSLRRAALAEGLMLELQCWRSMQAASEESYVFPSERGTALSKDNVWRRNMQPKLEVAGLGWVNFQVFRRSHATLMKQMGEDPKLVADQLGHSLDVSLNVYTQSSVESRLALVNRLESSLIQ